MKTMTVEEVDRARLWLREIQVRESVHHLNLTIFPLFRATEPQPDRSRAYRLLSEAVAAREAQVEEVDEGGQVPFLGVANVGTVPILIPEGEILIGAKQNRTAPVAFSPPRGTKSSGSALWFEGALCHLSAFTA